MPIVKHFAMIFHSILEDLNLWMHNTADWFNSSTSAMDVQTAVICGGVFVFSALVVYLISVFGMRERTYEEAMEEQRRRNQEAVQQKSEKVKKEKKFRKWGKRSKEKNDEEKSPSVSQDDTKTVSEDNEGKGEAEANSSSGQNVEVKETSSKKRLRQRKMIMIEKEDCSQPISSSDDSDNMPHLGNSPVTKQPPMEAMKSTSDKSTEAKEDFKQEALDETSEHHSAFRDKSEGTDALKAIRKSPSKKSKKSSKADHVDFTTEFREGNEARVLSFIKSNQLSEEEVQHILEVLGSKHKINEKKKSEISALKKIIQEKEDALRSEQKQSQSASDRIQDLLQELTEARAQASSNEKSLRDALHHEQQEIKSLHVMMQRKRDQYGSEMSALQAKMQQVKAKMKEEHALALQRMQEEQMQSMGRMEAEKMQRSQIEINRLQHEIEQLRGSRDKYETHQAAMQQGQEDLRRQIQQLEQHIEQLLSSHQEEEYSYKQRISELSNKLQQAESARSGMVQELQGAQSVCSGLEVDNAGLRQRLEDAKHQMKGSEQDLLQLQSRLEESNRQQRDLANCLEKMRDEVRDLSNFKREQLQIIQTLKKENEVLVSQANQRILENVEQAHQNGVASDKARQKEIDDLEANVKEKEKHLQRILQELEHCKCEISSLAKELESQKKTSKDLKDKNSELISMLQTSEKKLQEVIKNAETKVQEAQKKADNSTKEMQNRLNEQIKEVENSLRESYSKELKSVQQEAEIAKKEAEEKLSKSEAEANIRLEEFQESLYERLNLLNSEAEAKVKEAIKEKEKVEEKMQCIIGCIKHFLQRVFPTLDAPDSLEIEGSLTNYEAEVRSYIEGLKEEDKNHDSKDLENMMKKLATASEEKATLEAQIQCYKSVLVDTESVLQNLQNNIENEEKKWQLELTSKDEMLQEVQNKNQDLKKENNTLRTSLEQFQGLKEALFEIEELRVKLQKEESEKKLLLQKIGSIESVSTNVPIPVPENGVLELSEINSNNMPNKSEKKKKKKKGAAGKK
ncbi:hypothetical protein JTE90_013024 [Oedothorax gibbosus]|uniref:Kinectin n=1 Tax=Oedothorax gibbosus TaxID=931172 RepID=A0AAV6UCL3_9ARAC|nr:hypothetical protein JTE90_013024 [Oedothorax gibbosus]